MQIYFPLTEADGHLLQVGVWRREGGGGALEGVWGEGAAGRGGRGGRVRTGKRWRTGASLGGDGWQQAGREGSEGEDTADEVTHRSVWREMAAGA